MGKAIGIDLGTTNSVVAILEKGRPITLKNPTNVDNTRLTPSVVGIGYDGGRLIGELAKVQAISKSEDTVFSIKRFMGRYFRDSDVQRDIKRAPYEVTKDGQNGEVLVWIDGKPYSPPEISAFILESLKQQAEAQIGEEVTHAVITVPAYFTNRQKHATLVAGRLAGLEVMRLISEPTAAALAYGINSDLTEDKTILIYDLGGGTFDVTVFYLSAGLFTELAREGDNQLGGDDFDQAIINYIIDDTIEKYKVDLSWNREALQKLKVAAEKAKIRLSQRKTTNIRIPGIAKNDHGQLVHINAPLTRPEYEKMIVPLVRQTIRLVKKAMEEANMTANEIDQILLVGGSSLTPLVIEQLSTLFGGKKIVRPNSMECVAQGAAIDSAISGQIDEESEDVTVVACPSCAQLNLRGRRCRYCDSALDIDIDLYEITAYPLGIQTVGDKMVVMIDEYTYYPTSKAIRGEFNTAHANQTLLRVPVYEGFDPVASQNEWLGTAEGQLPPGLPDRTKVVVSFSVNHNNIIEVEAELYDAPTVKVEGKINWNAGSSPAERLWKKEAQSILNRAGSIFLRFGKNILTQNKIKAIEYLTAELQQAMNNDNQLLAENKMEQLKQILQDMGLLQRLIYAKYLLADLTQITPADKMTLERLVEQAEQAHAAKQQSLFDSICLAIEAFTDTLIKRNKSHRIDENGLLRSTR